MEDFISGFLDSDLWMRILASFICGLIIGLERQVRGKPVGVRTASLICIGSMSFIYIGQLLTHDTGADLARVLAQLITGIGFIGAGVIMNKEGLVNGVTSAAAIWILAGLGAAIGLGYYGQAVAISITTTIILVGFEYLENFLNSARKKFLQKSPHDDNE
ncbi:MgtC/SapB family protein [bacterium]|nr:MgtC/SapB family protein [bacterium]